MLPASYADILHGEGFHLIGELRFRLNVSVWWNPAADRCMQALVIPIGDRAIVKGDKTYYVKSVSAEGETWSRDVRALHDFLEGHLPELRLSFSHFRDVPPELAEAEVRRRTAIDAPKQQRPSVERIAELQRCLQAKRQSQHSVESFLSFSASPPDLLENFARQQVRVEQHAVTDLEAQLQQEQQRLSIQRHLQREYQRKGSAAVYTFTASSHLQVAMNAREFRDALRSVVRELVDLHRYEVTQRLQGGRLNIHVEESAEPVMSWIEQWMGGALSPTQLQRLDPAYDVVRQAGHRHVIVTPDEPIIIDDHTRHSEKHLAARVVSTMVGRLDRTGTDGRDHPLDPDGLAPEVMPLYVGLRARDDNRALGRVALPLTQFVHTAISGTTGSGKSFAARVLVEEAWQYNQLSILILDPRNQFAGLLLPEDRPHVLDRYATFGMSSARGFPVAYYAPALSYAPDPPADLASFATGRSIVSFKGMDDAGRCDGSASILHAVFDALCVRESARPRMLIVIDEAQLLTRKRVDKNASASALRAERALDRIAREGRKYGISLMLVSQAVKDFAYDLASLRQMINTRFFFRNSDNELEYADDVIGDGRALLHLPTGTALVHNAAWGTSRIQFRPPYSKVIDPPADVLRTLAAQLSSAPPHQVSTEAASLFATIKAAGEPRTNLSRVAKLGGIRSRGKLHLLIDELEQAGLIRTQKLLERGQPRVIELTAPQTQ